MKTLYESILGNNNAGKKALELGGYHIGDIVVNVHSYSARLVSFYEVIDIVGKATFVLRELKQELDSDSYGQNGKCRPIPGKYVGKEFKCRMGKYIVKIDSGHNYKYDKEAHEWEAYYTD